ncbi:TPA: hypothetical protein ACJMKJ_003049 [Bacillus wiedmannii]|uniref:hypothetical protein n=1 Tax=Bacillus toyonensis TaxID=155322 RepID=UPI00382F76FC
MNLKMKTDQYKEVIEQLIEKVKGITASGTIDEKKEKKILSEIREVIDKLQKDKEVVGMFVTDKVPELFAIEKGDVECKFYKELNISKKPEDWDWEKWEDDLKAILNDLEGDFEFFGTGEEEYNLNGSDLEIVRRENQFQDLKINLHNVGVVKFSRADKKIGIEVEVMDTAGCLIATLNEYIQTKRVAVVRENSNIYRYEYRG